MVDQAQRVVHVQVESECLAQLDLKVAESFEAVRVRVMPDGIRLLVRVVPTQLDEERLIRRPLIQPIELRLLVKVLEEAVEVDVCTLFHLSCEEDASNQHVVRRMLQYTRILQVIPPKEGQRRKCNLGREQLRLGARVLHSDQLLVHLLDAVVQNLL